MNNPFENIVEELSEIKKLLEEVHIKVNEKNKKVYSVSEAARILNVSPLTVRNHVKKGNIRALRLGRKIFIDHNELFDALNEVKSIKYKRDV